MPGRNYHKENTTIGSGECYIALLKSDGTYENERYLGDSPGASLTVETQDVAVDSSDGPTAEPLLRAVVSRSYTFNVQLGDISHENLQLFTGGDVEARTAANAAVTDEDHEIDATDRWIQLGEGSATPGGVLRPVTIAAIREATDASGSGAAVITTDKTKVVIEMNDDPTPRPTGRLYIPRTNSLAKKWLSVDYTPSDVATDKRVKVGTAKAIDGAFRYQETENLPGVAKPRHYYARLCSIRGDGQNDLKSREGPQRIGLVLSVQKPAGGYPLVVIDGEPQ